MIAVVLKNVFDVLIRYTADFIGNMMLSSCNYVGL